MEPRSRALRQTYVRVLLALALAAAALPLQATPADACSCTQRSPREHATHADAIFTGRLTRVEQQRSGLLTYQFAVNVAHKGAVPAVADVTSPAGGASCGLANMALGRVYTVFARDGDEAYLVPRGTLVTRLCSGTVEGTIDRASLGVRGGAVVPDVARPLDRTATLAAIVLAAVFVSIVATRRSSA